MIKIIELIINNEKSTNWSKRPVPYKGFKGKMDDWCAKTRKRELTGQKTQEKRDTKEGKAVIENENSIIK